MWIRELAHAHVSFDVAFHSNHTKPIFQYFKDIGDLGLFYKVGDKSNIKEYIYEQRLFFWYTVTWATIGIY